MTAATSAVAEAIVAIVRLELLLLLFVDDNVGVMPLDVTEDVVDELKVEIPIGASDGVAAAVVFASVVVVVDFSSGATGS